MVDLHIHDAHFIRLICGMPKAVQTVGRMRGEVVELFHTQFLFDDPQLVVTVTGGVINQQGRPFTHGYEIYLERATLLFDSHAEMPVTVLTNDGRISRPKLGAGDPVDDFATEMKEVIRAVNAGKPSPLLGRRIGPRRPRPGLQADRILPSRPERESVRGSWSVVSGQLSVTDADNRLPTTDSDHRPP